ncbi:MAG TPA: aminoacyl-tRNA hydrolase [Candidatus Binataceae bacterium]|nr:aminoacyl-tRNA hydrolase [Candidatus Binataceae bacterium]
MSRIGNLFVRFRPGPAPRAEPDTDASRWVVAGLGNPGEEYRRSRHNVGFMAAAHLAARHRIELNRRKFSGLYAETAIAGASALIVTPQTFYNRSGDCLASLTGYFKVPVEKLIVIHDEIDLPLRQMRIKRGGGDAGNRGVRSIAAALGPDFIRVRVGVGHPGAAADAIDHVLKPLTASEMRELEPTLDRVIEAVTVLIGEGLERAMSIFNQQV